MCEPMNISRPIFGCGLDDMRDQRAAGASATTALIDVQILKVAAVGCVPARPVTNMMDQPDGLAIGIAGDCAINWFGRIEQARPS